MTYNVNITWHLAVTNINHVILHGKPPSRIINVIWTFSLLSCLVFWEDSLIPIFYVFNTLTYLFQICDLVKVELMKNFFRRYFYVNANSSHIRMPYGKSLEFFAI